MDILFISKRIFLGSDSDDFINGGILATQDGIIKTIFTSADQVNTYMYNNEADEILDFENKILMPGLIDSHVHINEPGRKDWEGFVTATKAAAAGGFTTIVDMPLNSIPPTTTVENLKTKLIVARGKIYVDVAFWGGFVPENMNHIDVLVRTGVVGLKCFMGPTEVPEFSHVSKEQIGMALTKLADSGTVLAIHAEIHPKEPIKPNESEPKKYKTYLDTRPASMELNAIEEISTLSQNHKVRMHIVNLSSADAIQIIQKCKKNGGNLTVETCHHYLCLSAEEVPDASTEYKCSPPIREKSNQEKLWKAIQDKDIDLVVSDHSPSTPGAKCLTYGKKRGDFLNALSGISSNQFGLPLFWTNCYKYGLKITDVYRLMCQNPAKLCGIDHIKGKIAVGYHADFCVWDPDEEFTVTPEIIQFQNKANPYMNKKLRGVVHATIVRGFHVYQIYEGFGQPLGKVILRKQHKKLVKFASPT